MEEKKERGRWKKGGGRVRVAGFVCLYVRIHYTAAATAGLLPGTITIVWYGKI